MSDQNLFDGDLSPCKQSCKAVFNGSLLLCFKDKKVKKKEETFIDMLTF